MADDGRQYTEQLEAARLALSRGERAAAERLLEEALETGERAFGAEHPSLTPVLTELSRLHLRQSNHARAEAVLERLLRITRRKGEQHVDVATALTGLALLKRALGDHTAAEERFREALSIREQALAPQHMATIVTMEQLAETCAAREKFFEALALMERALPTRVAALGADHATVRALQSRIAELEIRASEPPTLTRPTSVPARELKPSPVHSAPVAPAPTAGAQWITAAERGVNAQSVALTLATTSAQSVALAELPAPATNAVVVMGAAPVTAASNDIAPVRLRNRRKTRYVSITAALVAVGIAGFGFSSRGGNDAERSRSQAEGGPSDDNVTPTSMKPSAAAAVVGIAHAPSAPAVVRSESLDAAAAATKLSPASGASSAAPSVAVALPSLRKLVVPKVAMPSADSLMRSSAKVERADAELIGAGVAPAPSLRADDPTVMPPVLIYAPTPHFPDELRAQRVEGEVLVQFRVTDKGRVDASTMQVLRSEHELFAQAVRAVLPKFKFQPAHSAAPGSKPQAAWVQFRTQFTAPR
jgi:TonB family protein